MIACQLPACSWTYSHERSVVVWAAWRQHYAAHTRGAEALDRHAATGTVHPVARPARYSESRPNRTTPRKGSP